LIVTTPITTGTYSRFIFQSFPIPSATDRRVSLKII
jgi:hypothetical protein